MNYNAFVVDSHTSLEIIGFALVLVAGVASAYTLIERLLGVTLFSVFWKMTPTFLQSSYPDNPFSGWLQARAHDNLHEAWELALFLLVAVSVTLFFMLGFWVFLILRLLGIYSIAVPLLILWFFLLFLLYFVSAGNQVAIEIKVRHRRADTERIKRYMQEDQVGTIKRTTRFFFRNWVVSPFAGLQILIIILLLIVLDGPAWFTKLFPTGSHLRIADDSVRNHYYIGYAAVSGIVGGILMFLFGGSPA